MVTAQDDQGKNPVQTPQQGSQIPAQSQQPFGSTQGKSTVGSIVKEQGPVGAQDWASVKEVTVPKELQEAGVETKPVVTPIPQAAQQAGVKLAKEATPITEPPESTYTLQTPHPLIVAGMKLNNNVKNGLTWLLRLIKRQQDIEEHVLVHKEKRDD